MTDDCTFCDVVAARLWSREVRSTNGSLAFYAQNPVVVGHTLVVPRRHVESVLDLTTIETARLSVAVARAAQLVVRRFGAASFNVLLADGPVAGRSVAHVHWHVVPRYVGDGLTLWPRHDDGAT